ncbi:unnamed protein product [Paramecium pentaurelia]|uniref:Transmembrane protein n=1 Tax=Paramecium pentaurelia TaxID=43138 RepID=A0A8S1W4Q0_9CILI|nr:unnamed protein product [Paramecium pentaurelia]
MKNEIKKYKTKHTLQNLEKKKNTELQSVLILSYPDIGITQFKIKFFLFTQKSGKIKYYQDTILSIHSYKLDDDIYVCLLFFTLLKPLFNLFVVLFIIYAQTILFYYIQDPHHWKKSQPPQPYQPTNPSTIIMYSNYPITIINPSIMHNIIFNHVHFYFQNNESML